MSSFKEQLSADLDVFVNTDEFADTHTFNDHDVVCVAQGLTTNQSITRQTKHAVDFDGISNQMIIVHIKTADMQEAVESGNVCEFDGNMYRIADVAEDMGITTLILEADIA